MDVFGLFAKHPQPGRVKTRLAEDLGKDSAADLYAAFLDDLLQRFRATGDRRVVGFAPNETESRQYFQQRCGNHFALWPQPDGDLGMRMAAFFADAFANGAARVVLIGSDSPTLPWEIVQQAFHRLAESACVIGPATDGGYYLIGMRRLIPELFRDIAWSKPGVLQQTVTRLQEARLLPSVLPVWYDVDSLDDLQFLRGHLAALQIDGQSELPSQTMNWLERHTSAIDSLL